MVNVLWKVILSECLCYVALNFYLVANWVIAFLDFRFNISTSILKIKSGRLNTMVNKFTFLSRVYGILYVIGIGLEKSLDLFYNEVFLVIQNIRYNE